MPTICRLFRGAFSFAFTTLAVVFAALPTGSQAAGFAVQQAFLGEQSGDQFSFSMTCVGDINDDGIADLLIGANVQDSGAPGAGKAYVQLGTLGGFAVAPIVCVGRVAGEQLGKSVAGSADLNGDGIDDWIVGAPGLGSSGDLPGRVYVYWGGNIPKLFPDLILQGTTAAGSFGEAVAVVPDFDGDGYADVVVGAPRDGNGRVFIFRGGPNMDTTADATVMAASNDARFGAALAWMEDQNSDGRNELVIGSPRSSRAATWAGAALVVFGTNVATPQETIVLTGVNAGDEFGASLATGADLNGDAHADLLVGSPAANPNGLVDAGTVYGFVCGPEFDAVADVMVSGNGAGDHLGTSLAVGFDWDGDGFEDYAVGAPLEDLPSSDAGASIIFRGGSLQNTARHFVIRGDATQQQLGSSLTCVRGENQTGFLVVGDSFLGSGRAQVFGRPSSPTDVAPSSLARSQLLPPWPNPFNPHVRTSLSIETAGTWQVQVFDARGQAVALLLDAALEPGTHELRWNGSTRAGRQAASGVYWIRARGPKQNHTARMTLVR